MNTCDTCKWWKSECHEEPSYKRCENLKCDALGFRTDCGDDPICFDDGFGVFDGECCNPGMFATGPKFGCIHHETKQAASS